jgi:hypothetical protein
MTNKKVPLGDKDLICRWHKLPMSEVCHRCDAWTHLQGRNPNTGDQIDDWKCADSWIPVLLLEIANRVRGVTSTVETLREEEVKAHGEFMSAMGGAIQPVMTALLRSGAPRLIEAKDSGDE